MLKILIVEDDSQLATTLKYLIEDNPRYSVIGIADDADSAIELAQQRRPDLALVDLHLARRTTGFSVAVRLSDIDVACLFVTGRPPGFPMPDLALGCLLKPLTAEEVHRALALAEDKLRGREAVRPKLPSNLTVYEDCAEEIAPQPGFIPSRRSLLTRFEHLIFGRAAKANGDRRNSSTANAISASPASR